MVTIIASFALVASVIGPCFGLGGTLDGPIVRQFAPAGPYAGHWGIDVELPTGYSVRAIGPGTVSFAGTVAGRISVTVAHGSGVRSSYSYLDQRFVEVGDWVDARQPLGVSGVHGDRPSVHVSLRVNDAYVDPVLALSCQPITTASLYLATPVSAYAPRRVRNSRRYVRPTTCGPSGGRPFGIRAA